MVDTVPIKPPARGYGRGARTAPPDGCDASMPVMPLRGVVTVLTIMVPIYAAIWLAIATYT